MLPSLEGGGGGGSPVMKATYIQPSILAVCLQHHGIICTSTTPDGYDGYTTPVPGGGGTIGDEGGVWTKEHSSTNLWDEEW